MIEKMYKAALVSRSADRRKMVSDLRDIGLMHISFERSKAVSTAALETFRAELADLQRIVLALEENSPKTRPAQKPVADGEFDRIRSDYLYALDRVRALTEETARLRLRLSDIEGWGDYDASDLVRLHSLGVGLHFYTIGKKELEKLPGDVSWIRLSPVSGRQAIAVVGAKLPPETGAVAFHAWRFSPVAIRRTIAENEAETQKHKARIADGASLIDAFKRRIDSIGEAIKLEMATCEVDEGDSLCWITGFIPEGGLETFRRRVSQLGYGCMVDEVNPEDEPPTKVIYNKVTRLMKPVFDMLGTVPGYYEYDISMWFLAFFARFFAMIIGDAAYGVIFLIAGALIHMKTKKASNAVLLIYVLGAATVIWGAMTGTWFGSRAILEACPLLQVFVVKEISNFHELFGVTAKTAQDTVMQLCFIVGTLQLSLACVMNVIRKAGAKDLSLVADIGWLVMIDALYFLVLLLVLNRTDVNAGAIFTCVGAGFVLVVVFGFQGPGIKFARGLSSGAGGLFTTFLNTISAFGNIMSYIRLFAVGMASLAIAESFNEMASPMLGGLALPAGVLVLVIGHGLNLVMGLLSVVVHGVRLNLLEFSGQLGMGWTGIAYEPFRKTTQGE